MNDQDNPNNRYRSLLPIFVLYPNVVDIAKQLQTAIQTVSAIDQATGIIMAKNHCSGDDAFVILAGRHSQRRSRGGDPPDAWSARPVADCPPSRSRRSWGSKGAGDTALPILR